MRIRILLAIVSILFTSAALSTLPPYIDKHTFTNICKNVSCNSDLNSKYISTYYQKQFHKALALSTSKSGNKYYINYIYWAYQYPSSITAKTAALNGCKKSASNCEIFLVNNSYANEALYNKLTKSASYSSTSKSATKIPLNSHKVGSGWTCNTNYYRNNSKTACIRVPTNSTSSYSSNYFICNSGYEKTGSGSGTSCVRKASIIKIPKNSHKVGSGWTCNTNYYRNNSKTSCLRVPANSTSSYSSNYFTCNPGYKNTGNSCIIKAEQETLLAKAKKVLEDVKNKVDDKNSIEIEIKNIEKTAEVEFWNSIKDSNSSDEYQAYLEEFPKGTFVKLAELRIRKLGAISTSGDQTLIPKLNYGIYHALVIGNDRYQHLNRLSNAVKDAQDVATLLRSKYQFNVNLLTNATRDEIVSAMSKLRNTISAKDNILVYYAGHGILDEAGGEGYWLPIDAERDNQVHWISNSTITSSVRAMNAKHVMVVADSCFSGTLTRGISIIDKSPDYITKIVRKRSRTVLTSGGDEPVSDGGGGGNSVFASSFLRILNENKGVLEGHQLFTKIKKQVSNNSDQTPEYSNIRRAGHDGGDFLFVRQ